MRIVLHDTLLERRLVDWLARALEHRGHTVLATGAVHHDQQRPDAPDEVRRLERVSRATLDFAPEAFLSFRPSSVPPGLSAELARRGVHRLVFFGDDPVLYAESSRDALARFDTALHAGFEPVLRFYDERHGPTGVTMPFWADPHDLPRAWRPERAEVDLVFFGSAAGGVRSHRVDLMRGLGVRVRAHGPLPPAPGIEDGGWVETPEEIVRAVCAGRAALNIPQVFSAYAGTRYDFPELAGLGHFWMPSRTMTYAALGAPIITVAPAGMRETFPGAVMVADDALAGHRVRAIVHDDEQLEELGRRSHTAFHRAYTADARAALIDWLVAHPSAWRELSVDARAHLYEQVAAPERPPSITVAGRPAASEAGPRRVVVSGYFGARNRGDDLLLETLVAGLERELAGGVEVAVASLHAELLQAEGITAFDRADLVRGEQELRAADALVVGPGGLLHDLAFARGGGAHGLLTGSQVSVSGLAQLPLLARVLGRPVHLVGLGAGPLKDPDACRTVALMGDLAASVTVRDEPSRALLRSIDGWTAPVHAIPDLLYGWELRVGTPPEAVSAVAAGWPYLAVNVRRWPDAGELPGRLRAALAEISRRHGLAVVGVPMQAGQRADGAALHDLLDGLETPHPVVVADWADDPAELTAILSRARAVVSMRLHACLLAHRLGRPAVGLAYDPKVRWHFRELDLDSSCVDLDAGEATLVDALARAVAQSAGLGPDVMSRIAALEAAARQALADLAGHLARTPTDAQRLRPLTAR